MPIRYKYQKAHAAEIPAALTSFYVERDGSLILDVDGVAEIETLTEFRENNRTMMRLLGVKDVDAAKAKLEKLKDIDPDGYASLQAKLKEYEDGKAPKLDELLATRTDAMKKEHTKLLGERDAAIALTTKKLQKLMIDDAITAAALKKGVLESAIEDVRLRGVQVFRLEDDEVIAYGVDNKARFGKNGAHLKVEEWIDELAEQAKHLFKPTTGGGSGGNGNKGGVTENPWSTATLNLTMQGKIMRENPTLAASLRASAAK